MPTRDRAPYLERLLRSLEAQTLPRDEFEIVVVDDGSTDGTPGLLSRETARQGNLRVVTQPGLGAARARNAGVRAAAAPVVAFTDSDCEATPDWLERLVARLEADPGAAGVEGRTATLPEEIGPFTHFVRNESGGVYATCNVAYRRELLLQVGGFDEEFTCGQEDTELALRMREHGPVPFESGAAVVHPPRPVTFLECLASTRTGLENELILYRKSHVRYRADHGCGPVWIATVWFGFGQPLDELRTKAPGARRKPLLLAGFLACLVCQRALLLVLLPWFLVRLALFEARCRLRE